MGVFHFYLSRKEKGSGGFGENDGTHSEDGIVNSHDDDDANSFEQSATVVQRGWWGGTGEGATRVFPIISLSQQDALLSYSFQAIVHFVSQFPNLQERIVSIF